MSVVDRPVRSQSSHPHPPKLKEVPTVFQFASLQFGLATTLPTGLYNDYKGTEANGPYKGSQTSPTPGLADQGPVSGGSTSHWKTSLLGQIPFQLS